jgi:hypothetical protein
VERLPKINPMVESSQPNVDQATDADSARAAVEALATGPTCSSSPPSPTRPRVIGGGAALCASVRGMSVGFQWYCGVTRRRQRWRGRRVTGPGVLAHDASPGASLRAIGVEHREPGPGHGSGCVTSGSDRHHYELATPPKSTSEWSLPDSGEQVANWTSTVTPGIHRVQAGHRAAAIACLAEPMFEALDAQG